LCEVAKGHGGRLCVRSSGLFRRIEFCEESTMAEGQMARREKCGE
jgi:hypothetical protein